MKIVLRRRTVETRRVVDPARTCEDNEHHGEERKELVHEPDSFVAKFHVTDIRVTDKKAYQNKVRSSDVNPSVSSKFIEAVANEDSRTCYNTKRNRCSRHIQPESNQIAFRN